MNSFLRFTVCALILLAFSAVNAQYEGQKRGFGLEIGGAYGDNHGDDESWSPRIKANYQFKIADPLSTQIGLSYTTLYGGSGYKKTKTVAGDVRFLYRVIKMDQILPFIYAGAGVAKNVHVGDSDFMPLIPIGIGLKSPLGEQLMIQFSGGYTLVLSDALDGVARTDSDLNRFTNGKHDGFFEIMIGLSLGSPKKEKPVEPVETAIASPQPVVASPQPVVVSPQPVVVDTKDDLGLSESDIDKLVADAVEAAMKERGKTIVLHGITFETDKAQIRPESATILEIVRESMVANPDVSVIITGHTDSVGKEEYNRRLSLERAQAVKDWLVNNNISAFRMKVIGKGETEPVATNETAEGRAENRRVEFQVE